VWEETSLDGLGPQEPPGRHDDPEQARAGLAAVERRRHDERQEVAAQGLDPDELVELHRTPASDALRARVTVCIPAYRAADVIEHALVSVAAQDLRAIEVIVHDDACPDHSGEIAAAWLRRHPWLAGRVLRRRANAGLPAGRNAMARLARAPYLLMLDADNELLAPCAGALASALDEDPSATFAYPVIAVHRDGEPAALLSYLGWDPELLRSFNPIDALALIRRDRLLELGGYTEDLSLYGWEDYDLWCRCAEAGLHGVHVPRPLARYHRRAGSMLSLTDLDQGGRMALLRLRHPRTMAS
jgi:glycosyltransferase involved in cell wall biosynthesis